LRNHYGIVAENSVKYVTPDGFFGIQILQNSISLGELRTPPPRPLVCWGGIASAGPGKVGITIPPTSALKLLLHFAGNGGRYLTGSATYQLRHSVSRSLTTTTTPTKKKKKKKKR